jgi:hypothetical protein
VPTSTVDARPSARRRAAADAVRRRAPPDRLRRRPRELPLGGRPRTARRPPPLPDGRPGGLNIAYEALDRHLAPRAPPEEATRVAIRWLGKRGQRLDFSYAALTEQTRRFANVLASLGVGEGGRVFGLAGRIPELYVAALGALRHRAVFCPLFSTFGPEPIAARLSLGKAEVLVTTDRLYRKKVETLRADLPSLRHAPLVSEDVGPVDVPGCHDLRALLAEASPDHTIAPTDPETPRCCTSRAAPPASPRARSTSTRPRSCTTTPAATRSTCTRARSTGARPIRAGSRARAKGSSRRSCAASR